LVHEATGAVIAFQSPIILWIANLRAVPHRTNTVVIALGWVGRHESSLRLNLMEHNMNIRVWQAKASYFMATILDDDGLLIDEVGPWAKDKHERLRRYVNISSAARRKFAEGSGGATYIDLYCGSGRSIIRDTGERIDGSPLVAFKCARDRGVPFTQFHITDASEECCRAARERIIRIGGLPDTEFGNATDTVVRIVRKLNPYGLHFALLDPFNLEDLPFSVIETLSGLRRIDMLIHVSAQDLQRNLHSYTSAGDTRLEKFMPGWREVVDLKRSKQAIRAALLAHWVSTMNALGLPPARHAELVSGAARNQRLYWLVFVSRSDFAKGLWDKIRSLHGQGSLPL
jgi:three-Cys-motif partner protein